MANIPYIYTYLLTVHKDKEGADRRLGVRHSCGDNEEVKPCVFRREFASVPVVTRTHVVKVFLEYDDVLFSGGCR
jgi:hypothetical protein